MKHIKMKYGFTLIELLVVVIIIAVLTAVAVPMYKHAALKSRFSKVMPVAKSIVEAQEVYYLGKNIYAANDEKDLLDVAPSGATTIELATRDQENQYNYVAASSPEVPGARYIMYQKHSPKFADTIQCEADENNLEAVWLCSKGLNGQLIDGSVNTAQGSYVTYLLSGTKKESDTLPTSLEKLAASLCEGKTNCDAEIQGKEVLVKECTGDSNNMTCINKTYNDTGTETKYEKVITNCEPFVNNAYSNGWQCLSYILNKSEETIASEKETCDLNYATWTDGTCTHTSGEVDIYYSKERNENGIKVTQQFSCMNNDCTQQRTYRFEKEGNQYIRRGNIVCNVNASTGDCIPYLIGNLSYTLSKIPSKNLTYWENFGDNAVYTIVKDTAEDTVTLESYTKAAFELTNSVTCAKNQVDWDKGICITE